jgi:signal transduction histidine kinase/ActR/RegA family two-component response regulator
MMSEIASIQNTADGLAKLLAKLRRRCSTDYYEGLSRIVLSICLVVLIQKHESLSILAPLDLKASPTLAYVCAAYHIGAQGLFIHLAVRPAERRLRSLIGFGLDLLAALTLLALLSPLGFLLLPLTARSAFTYCRNASAVSQDHGPLAVRGTGIEEDLLLSASHDLRAPLSGIIQTINALQDTPISLEQKHLLRFLRASSRVLESYANQLLDSRKLDYGNLVLDRSEVNLRLHLEELGDLAQAMAIEKGLEFELRIDPAVPPVWHGDAVRLDQILINLLSNACKFTDKGFVSLRVSLSDDCAQKSERRLLIAVADSGIGISDKASKSIFAPFEQPEEHQSRHHLGSGLGLAISQRIAKSMRGVISVVSKPNEGSVFLLDLPLAVAVPNKAAVSDDESQDAQEAQSPALDPPRFLVVDDDPFMHRSYRLLMAECGAVADTTGNGAEAIRKLFRGNYDAVLMDLNLADMSGAELLGAFPRNKQLPPIIVVTGEALLEMPPGLDRQEVVGLFTKPVDIGRMRKTLKKIVAERSRLRNDASAII